MILVVRLISIGILILIYNLTICFSAWAETFTFTNESWPSGVKVDIRMGNDTGKAENNPSIGPPISIPYHGSYPLPNPNCEGVWWRRENNPGVSDGKWFPSWNLQPCYAGHDETIEAN